MRIIPASQKGNKHKLVQCWYYNWYLMGTQVKFCLWSIHADLACFCIWILPVLYHHCLDVFFIIIITVLMLPICYVLKPGCSWKIMHRDFRFYVPATLIDSPASFDFACVLVVFLLVFLLIWVYYTHLLFAYFCSARLISLVKSR